MTAPIDPLKLDHAISLRQSGKTLREAAAEAGISYSTLRRGMIKRGVEPTRTTGWNRVDLPADAVIARYEAGESELALADAFAVSRNVIRRYLEAAGVTMRSHGEALRLRMEMMSAEDRQRLTAAAHASVRGRTVGEAELRRKAFARQLRGLSDSYAEQQMAAWLSERRERPVPQQAIGRYNVDLGVSPVAVELLGGSWHRSKPLHAQRTPYILNEGWHLLFVWVDGRRWPLLPEAADYVVAFLEEVRRDPPAVSQYRVIRGDAEEVARGSADDDQLTNVLTARRSPRR